MKSILIVIFSWLYAFSVAQGIEGYRPDRHHSIAITAGHTQTKDLNLHPKAFRGLSIGGYWERTIEQRRGPMINSRYKSGVTNAPDNSQEGSFQRNTILNYSAGIELEAINTTYEDFPSAAVINLKGNFRYLLPAERKEHPHYYIGPAARLNYGSCFYFNWDESHLYYANYLSGAVTGRAYLRSGNRTVYLGLEIPVVSVICRPVPNRPYKMDDMTFGGVISTLADNPEFAMPDKNFYIASELVMEYTTQKHKSRAVGANFMYHYMKAGGGSPYRHLGCVVTWKFNLCRKP